MASSWGRSCIGSHLPLSRIPLLWQEYLKLFWILHSSHRACHMAPGILEMEYSLLQHSVRVFVETISFPFGLSIGWGKNSLVSEYSAFLFLHFLPLVADSGLLSLRTIRIRAAGGVPADVDFGFEIRIIMCASTPPDSSHSLQTLFWRMADPAYTIVG